MRKLLTLATALSAAGLLFAASAHDAKAETMTLCWAAWDPANALVELSKDFTAETGIEMQFEFESWTNYAAKFLNELNSGSKLCDLIIGDSQWIGGSAENGYYVKLNDFFEANGISMDDFLPATVTGYSEWPKGTPNYWALPAMGDVVGWTYRKDWFEKPELQAEFKEKYGWDLGPPDTYEQLKQIAEFFQGREIDGKTVYGAAIYTERGSEGITMGATNVLYDYGFKYENPDKPYDLAGFVNSPGAVEGLEFYKELYNCCTPPGASDMYMGGAVDAFKSGQVALHMNFAFTWPGLFKDPEVGGDKIGFFPNPAGPAGHFAQLGGQGISVLSNTDSMDGALSYIKWFVRPEVQAKWMQLGGFSCSKAALEDPAFLASAPYAKTFLDSMSIVKDFWAEPAYAELLQAMQKRVHDYVVADQGTAQEALDLLVADWTETYEDEGKIE